MSKAHAVAVKQKLYRHVGHRIWFARGDNSNLVKMIIVIFVLSDNISRDESNNISIHYYYLNFFQ